MRKIRWLIAALVITALLPAAISVIGATDTVDSGTCGTNLTWTLDASGTLTISSKTGGKN